MKRIEPLNNFVLLFSWFGKIRDKQADRYYEQPPYGEEVIRKIQTEDIEERPVEQQNAHSEKKRP